MEFYESSYDQKLYNLLYNNPEAILYLKNCYQTERVWKYCIEIEPNLFASMKSPSPEMCEYALDVAGENIITMVTKFKHIKLTKRMVYIALRTYPSAILYVPEDILEEDMLDKAFDAQPSLIGKFTNLSYEYLLKKVREKPSIIKWIENPREELVCAALEIDPNLCVYFTTLTPQMINIIQQKKPELAEMYANTLESETDYYAEISEEERAEYDAQWADTY